MVTFTDIDDPLSIVEVTAENFTAVFGPDYIFKSMRLQITKDKVTSTDAVSVLGPNFFKKLREFTETRGLARDKTPAEILALSLSRGRFIRLKK